ncbi:PREDICTED: uncharacterized protein LOC108972416 [Bactrocera latifrons]|nr:PREDICTED: uncharacterized protein LOC108972416 [Bactrocera latifrons]
MKPKTLCLPFLIVAFLFASDIPSVQGMYLTNNLLSRAAQELSYLISGVGTDINDVLFERSKMRPFTITVNNPTEAEKDGSEIGDISQKTYVTDPDNAMENLAEKNGSANVDPQELSTLVEKLLNWISFLNILKSI